MDDDVRLLSQSTATIVHEARENGRRDGIAECVKALRDDHEYIISKGGAASWLERTLGTTGVKPAEQATRCACRIYGGAEHDRDDDCDAFARANSPRGTMVKCTCWCSPACREAGRTVNKIEPTAAELDPVPYKGELHQNCDRWIDSVEQDLRSELKQALDGFESADTEAGRMVYGHLVHALRRLEWGWFIQRGLPGLLPDWKPKDAASAKEVPAAELDPNWKGAELGPFPKGSK